MKSSHDFRYLIGGFVTELRASSAKFVVAFALVSFLAGSLGVAASARSSTAMAMESSFLAYQPSSEECEFLNIINEYRAENGLRSLQISQKLGAAAKFHSADMARNNYFSHILDDGSTWSQNIQSTGYDYNTYRGENIAAGNYYAEYAFTQWVNSPTHNANMLNPDFTVIGIGLVSSDSSDWIYYWTTTFGGYTDETVSC